MQSVTVVREYDTSREGVRGAMRDIEAFTRAAGFDDVEIDGDTIRVANQVGVASIELTLTVVDDTERRFAYEQRDGIFEEMHTTYTVEDADAGCKVTAQTEFAIDVAVVGSVLDATIIKRQRRRELTAQLDWLETRTDRH